MMENFQKIILKSNNKKKIIYSSKFPDKGYKNQYESFFSNLKFNKFSFLLKNRFKL